MELYHPLKQQSQTNKQIFHQLCRIVCIFIVFTALIGAILTANILATSSSHRILSSFTTTSNRTQNVQKYCSSRVLYDQSEIETVAKYRSTLDSLFHSNSTQKAKNIYEQNFNQYFKQYGMVSAYSAYVGPYVAGMLLILLISPCLFCCCCFPNQCPLCCRKAQNEGYTQIELLIPVIFLFIMLLISIGVSIPGMTYLQKPIENAVCSFSTLIDDVINGNVTSDGKQFFAGYNTIVTQLQYLQNNITNIKTEINKLNLNIGSVMFDSTSYATTALNSISIMPNGANTNSLVHSYTTPLVDDQSNTGTLNSQIATKIGVYTDSNSYTGSMYSAVKSIKDQIQQITNSSIRIFPQLDALKIGVDSENTIQTLKPIINSIQSFEQKITSYIDQSIKLDEFYTNFLTSFYSVIIALSLLNLIATILLKCFGMIACRFIMYTLCIGLLFMCILGFLITIIGSSILPGLYFVCQAFQQGLSSQQQTQKMLNYFGASVEQAQYFRICISGNGDIISKVSPSLADSLTDLENVVLKIPLVDFSTANFDMNQLIMTVSNSIDKYGNSELFDYPISSTLGNQQIMDLNKIATKNYYIIICPSGSYNSLYSDVWVPSISVQSTQFVSCQGKQAISTIDCNPMTSCPFSRCLGLFDFLKFYSSTSALTTDLDTRYGTCNDFDHDLISYYNRYVHPVNSVIGNSISDSTNISKLAGRFQTSKTDIETYYAHLLTNVKPLFDEISGNLSQKVDSITNAQTGLLKGLNCKLIGQDAIALKNSICVGGFKVLFLELIFTGIVSFCLGFGVCLTVCVGVQHWKDYQMSYSRKIYNNMEQQSMAIIKNDISMSVIRSR